MESYFRIGEISSIFNIPLQTLRYYDKIGLFSPVYTNQETGYRYYSLYQLPLLHQIKTFKNMGIPFSEIKELTSTDWNIDKMDQVYVMQLERIEQNIRELQTLKTELEAKRRHFLALQDQPKNQISVKPCKSRDIFCKPIDLSTYKEQEAEYYRSFLPFYNQIGNFIFVSGCGQTFGKPPGYALCERIFSGMGSYNKNFHKASSMFILR